MTDTATEDRKASLFTRIGGQEAITAAVEKMYSKILNDNTLSPFFKDLDMNKLRRSQTAFMVMAFGGPHKYEGKDLRATHDKMVKEQKLGDEHFNAVGGHLSATLSELGVADDLVQEVMDIVGTTRDSVLGRA